MSLIRCRLALAAALESGSIEPVAEPARNTVKQGLAGAYLSRSGGNPTITGKAPVLKMASQAAELLLRYERELPGACAELRAAGQAGDWEARQIAWDRAHDLMRWIEILKQHV